MRVKIPRWVRVVWLRVRRRVRRLKPRPLPFIKELAHRKGWSTPEHLRKGSIGYQPDPRYSSEAVAERMAEMDKRKRRADLAESRRKRAADASAGIRRLIA